MLNDHRYSYLVLLLLLIIIKSTSSIHYIEDVDSLRFALSVNNGFDLLSLQPHFPGYPVFCFFAKYLYLIIGNTGIVFSFIGAISTFILIYFTNLFLKIKINSIEGLFVACIICFNPMIWIMGNRYMPDLMGLSLFFASFFYLVQNDFKQNILGSFLGGLLLGVRLSYFPLILFPIFILLKRVEGFKKKILLVFLSLGILVWLAPMILVTGWNNFLHVVSSQTLGHFNDYGGTIITESNWIERIIFFIQTIWSDGLGGYWPDRSWTTLPLSLALLYLIVPAFRLIKSRLKNQKFIKIFIISIIAYSSWVLLFQNVIYKSRHVLPIVFGILFIIIIYLQHLYKDRLFFKNIIIGFFIFNLIYLSLNLSFQHKQGVAVFNASEYLNKFEQPINIVSTPLINFYFQSVGVQGDYYSVDDTHDLDLLRNNLQSGIKNIVVGDFQSIFTDDTQFVLDTSFYHNPYMNRMWAAINIYSD